MAITSIIERVREVLEGLSPQLRRAARYIASHPEEVAMNSMRRVAEHAGVQPSTMVRLARALDYDSYEAFREPFRLWLKGGEGAYAARARTLQERSKDDKDGKLIGDMLSDDIQGLQDCAGDRFATDVHACTEIIAGAERVFVLGLRSCHSVAFHFHYLYRMVRNNSRLVVNEGGLFADNLRGMKEGDVMMVIGLQPYSRETVEAMDYAIELGATCIAVTDSHQSPLARRAVQSLVVGASSRGFFHTLVPATAAVQVLVSDLVTMLGQEALDAIGKSESQLTRFGAYWPGTGRRKEGAKTP